MPEQVLRSNTQHDGYMICAAPRPTSYDDLSHLSRYVERLGGVPSGSDVFTFPAALQRELALDRLKQKFGGQFVFVALDHDECSGARLLIAESDEQLGALRQHACRGVPSQTLSSE